MTNPIAIAIHGGAGTITRENMTAQNEMEYRRTLEEAIQAGHALLNKGGTALEAVELAVRLLEDCPLYNAGKGSVFTKHGRHEMDASIMCGKTLNAGAVTGVKSIRNPVLLAHAVMKHSDHVMLSNAGAEEFARKFDLKFEPEEYFYTRQRYEQWQLVRDSDYIMLDHTEDINALPEKKFGTVGAVALDINGDIAAATSTGGMTNKNYQRIGDTPIIGAGTYANNKTCAVSCTGHGEYFIRAVVAYDVSCLMEYKGLTLQEACDIVVKDKLVKLGGEGGLIALNTQGDICLSFNSEGMYRASKKGNEATYVGIYAD